MEQVVMSGAKVIQPRRGGAMAKAVCQGVISDSSEMPLGGELGFPGRLPRIFSVGPMRPHVC